MNARTFVRVTLDGTSGGNGRSGSRASDHEIWHTEQYSRCGLNGWLAPDTANPSHCEPRYSWAGPRTVAITAGATTCGFIAFHYSFDPYVDANGNGSWDGGESFTDQNWNGTWDVGEPFIDQNGNGTCDGEIWQDRNGDGMYDASPYWMMTNSLDGTIAWSTSATPTLTQHGASVTITAAPGVPHGGWLMFSVFNSQRPASPGVPAGTKVQAVMPGSHTNLLGAR